MLSMRYIASYVVIETIFTVFLNTVLNTYHMQNNYTALHLAAQDCHVSVVELLVSSGADIDVGDQV